MARRSGVFCVLQNSKYSGHNLIHIALGDVGGIFWREHTKHFTYVKEINSYFIFYCPPVFGQSVRTEVCLTLSRPNEIAVGQPASGRKLVLA